MLRSYLRLALFALGLLLGVQVPGFLEAYSARVEAHRLEAERSLRGFEDTARRFFDGNMDALVAHYRDSTDPVMRNDAQSIAALALRGRLLENESAAMQGPWYRRAWHVVVAADRELLDETLAGYRYQVLLAPEAIAWGLCCALALAWLVEGLLLLLGILLFGRSRRLKQRRWA